MKTSFEILNHRVDLQGVLRLVFRTDLTESYPHTGGVVQTRLGLRSLTGKAVVQAHRHRVAMAN